MVKIADSTWQMWALCEMARGMAAASEDEALLDVIHRLWRLVDKREDALVLFPLIIGFIPRSPEFSFALLDAYAWVDSLFLKG